jgi:dTMP kinase
MHLETEAMLMFAARREHLDKVIEAGAVERRVGNLRSLYRRNLRVTKGADAAWIGRACNSSKYGVQRGRQPDLTLLFDLAPAVGRARAGRIKPPTASNRSETISSNACDAGFLRRAAEARSRYASSTPAPASPMFVHSWLRS